MSGSVIGAIIAAVVLTAIAFAHPIGAGLMLAIVTPFDAIPFMLFGTAGNLITYVPVVIFLLRVNPGYWGQVFLGTRIQQWAALLVMAMIVSHAMLIVDYGIDQVFEWLRKVTLFLLMGIFAWSMRDARHLALLSKAVVAAMALFVFLAALDFYLGIQVLPLKAGLMEGAALDTEFETHLATTWRFTGPAFPVNRFSNYLLLPIFLGFGWFMSVRSSIERTLALGCTAILVIGELLTVTRSGILGMAVGMALLLPLALRFRFSQVVGLILVGGAVGVAVYYVLGITSGSEVLAKRFDVGHVAASSVGRLDRIIAAFQIWGESPFVGVGWGAFRQHSWRYITSGGLGAHNGYMNVLAECGLVGFVPLMILTVAVVRRHLVNVTHLSPGHEFWRAYFLCGLVAQLTTNVFNDYLWERYLWVNFAFVVVLENLYHAQRAKQARARLEHVRSLGSRRPFVPEASSPGGA